MADRFLMDCASALANSATYVSDGDGTYWHAGPCGTCGGHSFVLDDTPSCVTCTARSERTHVNVEWLQRSLDELLADVRQMTDEERRTVVVAALVANVQLQKLLAALSEVDA